MRLCESIPRLTALNVERPAKNTMRPTRKELKAYKKAWREANKARLRGRNKAYYATNTDKARALNRRNRYGTATATWADLAMERQRHLCAICRRPETSKRSSRLAVDHCHDTQEMSKGLPLLPMQSRAGLIPRLP